jgi:hypothetical protein
MEFDVLVLLDGDGQHNPDEIPQLIEPISNDAADLVIGFRSLGQMPFYRRNKNDFAIESEMVRAANDQNLNLSLSLRIAEVPIQCKYGSFDTSTKNPVSHGVGVLNSVIGLIAEKRPLLFFEKDLYSMKKFMLNKSISKQ